MITFQDDYRDWQNDIDAIMEETEGEREVSHYDEAIDEVISE